jgi:hypothetical protein
MSVPQYKARKIAGKPASDDMSEDWEVLEADGQVILTDVPGVIVVDVVEALEHAYAAALQTEGWPATRTEQPSPAALRAAAGAIERYCDNLGIEMPSPALARALAREALVAAGCASTVNCGKR